MYRVENAAMFQNVQTAIFRLPIIKTATFWCAITAIIKPKSLMNVQTAEADRYAFSDLERKR